MLSDHTKLLLGEKKFELIYTTQANNTFHTC